MRYREIIESPSQIYYHVSETTNESTILSRGILRKDKDFPPQWGELEKDIATDINPDIVYKNRIYLFKIANRAKIMDYMASVFSERFNLTRIPRQTWLLIPYTVFAVDISKLKDFVFHDDPASQSDYQSVWTDSGDIPPSAITVYFRETENDLTNPKVKDTLIKLS